jgi:hypothetical protein
MNRQESAMRLVPYVAFAAAYAAVVALLIFAHPPNRATSVSTPDPVDAVQVAASRQ